MEDHQVRKVTVLGGGTAGGITASHLGKTLDPEATITVLEAPVHPQDRGRRGHRAKPAQNFL